MKLKHLLGVFCILVLAGTTAVAQPTIKCLQGLEIRTTQGETDLINCLGEGLDGSVKFQPSSYATPIYFLVTDENNIIRLASLKPTIDLTEVGEGDFRVYALSFVGSSFVEPGLDATTAELASVCYELSVNYVSVRNIDPEAGTVATTDGETALFTCTGDGNPDIVNFSTSSTDPFYTYIITDDNNVILGFTDEEDRFDFEGADPGVSRVWGLSFVGDITAQPGDDLMNTPLASRCFDLSENFVEVTHVIPDGGNVELSGGGTSATVCAGNENPDVLSFIRQTPSLAPYAFVLTDENNNIIQVLEGDSFDFNNSPAGICRVWGLSYTGNITAQPGDNAAEVPLTDDCADLSDNFITVTKKDPEGGKVTLEDGNEQIRVCVNDGAPDPLTFVTSAQENENYVFVITDESNFVLGLDDDGVIDFEGSPGGVIRVWGVAYTGNLTLEEGDNLAEGPYSDECSERSTSFVTVTRIALEAGRVITADGTTEVVACLGDSAPDLLQVQAEGASSSGSYTFILTDDANVILEISDDGSFDFGDADPGICRIWGLNYTGNLTAGPGDNAAEVSLSDECYDLSDSFFTVDRKFVDGGRVMLEGNGETPIVCTNDGAADNFTFVNTSTSTETYIYVVTDMGSRILFFDEDGVINFEGVSEPKVRVWGISYTGNLIAQPGDGLGTAILSDECYERSFGFATLSLVSLDGGTITTAGGSTEETICLDDRSNTVLEFQAESSSTQGQSIFVVTDDNNVILSTSEDGVIDFAEAPAGTRRVWNLNYTGNLIAQPGDNAAEVALSDECFDLSDNFVTVNRKRVDGGVVSLDDGSTDIRLCANDGVADELTFRTQNEGSEQYIFVVTDENNLILSTSESGVIDFEGADPGICRVWGLSYSGNLTAQAGDNAVEIALSDECFDLSDNFVTVTRLAVEGGTVSLPDGITETVVCQGDAASDVLTFESQGAGTTGSFIFVVTDDNNIILNTSEDGVIDFSEAPEGICRVWGLNYTGDLIAQPGDNAAEIALSDECFDLSDNFATVTRKLVDGGTVSLTDGGTSGTACVRDGEPDIFEFASETSADNSDYTFIVTDENNLILVILEGNSIDFDVVPPGTCFVYGVSYTGELTTQINIDVTTATLSDECFELSDNFITITKEQVIGGTVMLTEGGEKTFTCPSDDMADPVVVTTTGGGTGDYVFLITDTADVVTGISEQPVIDFNGADAGIYRIRGLAYSGNLSVAVGDDINEVPLSDQCARLSDNFISVNHLTPVAGTVALEDGSTSSLNCPTSSTAPILTFVSSGADSPGYAFLVTDTSNIIQALPEGNSYDFSLLPNGIYRVWGLGYSGNLIAEVGDDAAQAMLSDNCFALSDNFVLIVNEEPQGGTVATENGDTLVYTCPGDGNADVLRFDSTGAIGDYRYLITGPDNVITHIIEADTFDFEALSEGVSRVWGVGFTGNLTATEGDNAAEVALSDDCYSLSDNFIEVIRAVPDGGSISADTDELSFCAGDGRPDLVTFTADPVSAPPYVFLITDENNVLQTAAFTNEIDFDTTGGGPARIWGLAYTGNLSLPFGETVEGVQLSDDCFDLSDNFIEVNRTGVDGGTINSNLGGENIYICQGDGQDDIVTFSNTSTADNAPYQYVLTNEDNRVLRILEGEEQNFENIGLPRVRIWGISYTGDLLLQVGQTLTETPISDGCYTLSDNFITSVQTQPEGGVVRTEEQEIDLTLCIGQQDPLLSFEVSTSSEAAQVLLLTDRNNTILEVLDSLSYDFSALDNGDYRIWNLSYTGLLLAGPGQDAAVAELASSCFDLSENFVAVQKGGPVDGGMINTIDGDVTFTGCPRNGVADILILRTSSTANGLSPYRYVITDTTNRILIPDIGGSIIDFDGAEPGRYRVWGVSFTGTFTGGFGQNILTAVLSNECYEVSANFIDIFHEGPQGGQISTTDGETGPLSPASCGGEAPDELSFTDNGTATDAEGYAFLITRNDSILAVVPEGESFDFATLSCEQTYQVTGLAYAGELPELTGLFISDLLSGTVFEDCFDLSDNRIEINPDAGLQDQSGESQAIAGNQGEKTLRELHLAPNPARQWLQVRFKIDEPQQETSEILIINTSGGVMRRAIVPTGQGENQLQINIETLPEGIFFLHVRHAQHLEYQRFIKMNN